MYDLIISAHEISDLRALGAPEVIPDLIKAAREAIAKGGAVVIEQKFVNAAPQVIARYTTQSEIDDWEKRIQNFLNQFGK